MPPDEIRSAPERFLNMVRQRQRGRLKIYLGFAAGVGKTYEMLQEGNRLKRQGMDVLIGFVETHGREETAAQIGELEQVPRRRIEYRGIILEEMDLDALLTRHPGITLVDELAHANAPGSRNTKRYQDVEELLVVGINVICTLNIQHLESLHDLVEQATGVQVKERIPDYILAMADELVNVDVSIEDLRERLRTGKVYSAERIEMALTNFFTQVNLTRLRELALEEVAHRIDHTAMGRQAKENPGRSERVMVCLSSKSPHVDRLLRVGARLADRLNAPWYAVYIQTPHEMPARIDSDTQKQIQSAMTLCQQLGGTAMTFKGSDVVRTIATFSKEYGITHIVIGRTRRPWYYQWLQPSLLDRLLEATPDVDVLIAR